MTDARFPERWLHDRRIVALSPVDFRGFMFSLAWSASNRTDGHVMVADLPYMGWLDYEAPQRFVLAGVWAATDAGWYMLDYPETQTTRAELEQLAEARRKSTERKRKSRANAGNVTRDVTSDITRTGQARLGQAQTPKDALRSKA